MQARYDQLWRDAIGRIQAGQIDIDPVLQGGSRDNRRGFTLIARPSTAVQRAVAALQERLRAVAPEQYYYDAAQLHVTMLSLFTATRHAEPLLAQRDAYVRAADEALSAAQPIHVSFEGVTASPGTVMIQGFVDSPELESLRDRLRSELHVRGLGGAIDERYRLQTAHMTAMRFRARLLHRAEFVQLLDEARSMYFGGTTIEEFFLVENDWYMSPSATQIVKQYPARAAA